MDYAETRRNAENLAFEVGQKAVKIKTFYSYYSQHEKEEKLTKNRKFSFFQ